MFHLTLLLICGLVASQGAVSKKPKIVGGTGASISSYPYLVSLQLRGGHFCGGSIYNSRYILTAAHCLKDLADPTNIKIRYGSSDWSSGGTLVGVSKAIIHPYYTTTVKEYDIALLKTSAPIVWSTNVRNVYLATEEPANDATARIAGWGSQKSGAASVTTKLLAANVRIISRPACKSAKYGYGESMIKSTMICAAANGIDSCQGDSGGPLISGGAQVGVVSFGIGCANSNYPGVYASVAVLRNFVTNNAI